MARFGDLVSRVNTKEDRFNTDKVYYVGGEHIESNELSIHAKGIIEGSTIGPMFYFGFKASDILFVTRNPHLRKAAMVEFDGICSEKTLVLATNDNSILLQNYLAIVMQSDDFWEYCEDNKSGGVNYFINWSTLEEYEFDLPPIDEQKKIASQVWAAYRLKEAYKRLLAATDEMVKSQFIEWFGSPELNDHGLPIRKLGNLGTLDRGVSKVRPRNRADLYEGDYPFIQTGDITKADRYIFSHSQTYSETGLKQSKLWPSGTLCITIAANIAETAILTYDCCFPDSVVGFIPSEKINLTYIQYWFKSLQQILERQAPQTAQKNINLQILSQLDVMLPPKFEQERFSILVEQADKSKFELKRAIEAIDKVIKSLING